MSRILITGSQSGLGMAMLDELTFVRHSVLTFDHDFGDDVTAPDLQKSGILKDIDVLINCAGVNSIEWLENFPEDEWDRVMDTNAKGIFMMTKVCLPMLIASKGTVINIVSNASHVPMRCSLAYNASKAAAHMMTLQLARELTPKYGITVFGISPNKMSGTGMSRYIDTAVQTVRGMTAEQAEAYQRQSLLVGEETPPDAIARFVSFLLSTKENHKYLSGCVIPYGA